MTDPTDRDPPADDARALAGELALRVLSPEEERAARAREASDPAFARDVDSWNEHLAGLADGVAPVKPSAAVWPRVEAGIGAVSANDNGRTAFWRAWAVGSTGLLAASLAAVALLIARPAPAPIVQGAPPAPVGVTRVASLASPEGGAPVIALAYDTATGNLFVIPTGKMNASGVPHLWLVKPEGGVQLVGAIDGSTATKQTLTSILANTAGQATAVAISIEAPGHTPAADKPDGPVVASGALTQL